MQKSISIITITYNNYDELLKTIHSIPINFNFESIIINGGTCSKTENFLKSFSGIFLSEPDSGIADAFNKGIRLASGKYILFLNSGDSLHDQNYINKSIDFLNENNNYGFVYAPIIFKTKKYGPIVLPPPNYSLGRGQPYFHQTMICRRSLFDKIGFFDTTFKIATDYEWILRLSQNKIKGFKLTTKPVVVMDGHGISSQKEFNTIKESFSALVKNDLLNVENFIGFFRRFIFFLIRKVLNFFGISKFFKYIKHSKWHEN